MSIDLMAREACQAVRAARQEAHFTSKIPSQLGVRTRAVVAVTALAGVVITVLVSVSLVPLAGPSGSQPGMTSPSVTTDSTPISGDNSDDTDPATIRVTGRALRWGDLVAQAMADNGWTQQPAGADETFSTELTGIKLLAAADDEESRLILVVVFETDEVAATNRAQDPEVRKQDDTPYGTFYVFRQLRTNILTVALETDIGRIFVKAEATDSVSLPDIDRLLGLTQSLAEDLQGLLNE